MSMKAAMEPSFACKSPLGATHLGNGWWNFAIYSPRRVRHLALGDYSSGQPKKLIPLDPLSHRTGDVWHICVRIEEDRFVWGWEIEPIDDARKSRYALDPYAPLLKTGNVWGKNAWKELAEGSDQLVCVAATQKAFPWKKPVHIPLKPDQLVIYEAHVRGWTKDLSSRVRFPGTYLGMIEVFSLSFLLDAGLFSLEDEVPRDVSIVNQLTQLIGIPQGNMTDEQAAAETVRQFFQALIDKDYKKAGSIYSGVSEEKAKEIFSRLNVTAIISIGSPTPHPETGPHSFRVPCEVEITTPDGKKTPWKPYGPFVRRGDDELHPDRWIIHGGI